MVALVPQTILFLWMTRFPRLLLRILGVDRYLPRFVLGRCAGQERFWVQLAGEGQVDEATVVALGY